MGTPMGVVLWRLETIQLTPPRSAIWLASKTFFSCAQHLLRQPLFGDKSGVNDTNGKEGRRKFFLLLVFFFAFYYYYYGSHSIVQNSKDRAENLIYSGFWFTECSNNRSEKTNNSNQRKVLKCITYEFVFIIYYMVYIYIKIFNPFGLYHLIIKDTWKRNNNWDTRT